jgi:hypothetical protein
MRPRGAALELMRARGALGEQRIGQLSRRPWHSGEFGPVPAGPVDALDAAVIRSWQDRFGARLCAVGHDCLALSVASPPVSPEHCLRVGAEHLAYETREALVDGIATPLSFEEYAARLSGSSTWWFWWD